MPRANRAAAVAWLSRGGTSLQRRRASIARDLQLTERDNGIELNGPLRRVSRRALVSLRCAVIAERFICRPSKQIPTGGPPRPSIRVAYFGSAP